MDDINIPNQQNQRGRGASANRDGLGVHRQRDARTVAVGAPQKTKTITIRLGFHPVKTAKKLVRLVGIALSRLRKVGSKTYNTVFHNRFVRKISRSRPVLRVRVMLYRNKYTKRFFVFYHKHRLGMRLGYGFLACLAVFGVFLETWQPRNRETRYHISQEAQSVFHEPIAKYADKLQYDKQAQKFEYNKGYTAQTGEIAGKVGGPKFTASFHADPAKGIEVADPLSQTTLTMKPKFGLDEPRKDGNRLVYPVKSYANVQAVYSLGAAAVKEDILVNSFQGDTLEFAYELGLAAGTEARLEKNGAVGIWGAGELLGNVTTGSDKDAELLQKARQNAKKTKLLYTIPAPFIMQADQRMVKNNVRYTLENNILTVHAEKLKDLAYPLSIDPSIYVETATKLMRGNNESNMDFDITNELIQKSPTTGARIDAWTATTSNTGHAAWGQGIAAAGGFIYSAGGVLDDYYTSTTFYADGSTSWQVPTGVTSVVVKAWGAGGGGGSNGDGGYNRGGNGGGGGYAQATISVTPGENLTVDVGTGGAKATVDKAGGNGGGFSAVRRSSTYLVQAGGGGGGGGYRGTWGVILGDPGEGGAGGGSSGVAGDEGTAAWLNADGGNGGNGGSTGAGGTGGSAGASGAAGATGAANAGGNAGGWGTNCNSAVSSTGGAGGTGGGGGAGDASSCQNGGGGGGGRYGGGGGGSASSSGNPTNGGGGGGGGSSLVSGTGTQETAGSGQTPGQNIDAWRNGAGQGGSGAQNFAGATNGTDGAVIIRILSSVSTTTTTRVSWAKFNNSTSAVESPTTGDGTCAEWCNKSDYDLPAARKDLSLVAYNGFLYALGGQGTTGCTGSSNTCNTVYIAKIGANGEPQKWHPTDTNQNNWVYWYSSSVTLSTERSQFGAFAYNNRLYVLGGKTDASPTGVSTAEYADIKPTGDIGSWTTTGAALPSSGGSANRYGHSALVYNGTAYIVAGRNGSGTFMSDVWYVRLKSDGTMNTWQQTSGLDTTGGFSGRMSYGGNFASIFGGYMYLAGGCTAVNGSGYCTTMSPEVQLASINADGSLATWGKILNLDNTRVGHTLITWQNGLYRVGGCRSQNSGTGNCDDVAQEVDYGVINPEGEASTVATSVQLGVAPCTGTPYNCDLPSTGNVGNVLNGSAILNGYLYVWGGCAVANGSGSGCGTVSRGVVYASIGSDGILRQPSSCGSWSQTYIWCYNTTSLPTGGTGAPATAVFNGRIYSIGGFTAGGTANVVWHAAPNSAGDIGSWDTSTTLSGITATAVSYAFAFARANPASAGSNPGNLYILGGCTNVTGIGCSGSNYSDRVLKCDIGTSGDPSGCSESGQEQIGTIPGASNIGLGAMAGTVYANYVYLMGGLAPSLADLTTTRYARIDNNNNIVAINSGWEVSPNETFFGRRRGSGFGYNGYLYVVGGYDGGGGGILADIEFAKINVSDGSIGTWRVSTVNINQRWGLTTVVSNSYAYVIGGCIYGAAPTCNTSGKTDSIQTFQIYNNESGAVQAFTASAGNFSADTDRWGASATILNGYLYVAGGCISATDCTDAVNTTQYAQINVSDGSIGTWSAGGALPAQRAWGQLVAAGGTLYYAGGQDDTAGNEYLDVYYTSSISSGNPTWAGATNDLPAARTKAGAAVWNNRIYIVGGNDSSGTDTTTVYVSPQLNSGGDITSAWASSTAFNVARYGAAVTAYANNLYLFGGNDGTNYLSDSQFTQINSDGTVDSWTYTTSLPGAVSQGSAYAANGYMYVINGRSATSTCQPNTIMAPISANTTIASGNNPTGVGQWFETNVKYTGDRYGAAVAYSNGKVYMMGGGCTAPLNANRHYYGILKAQPQIAQYSRMMDTDTDVFPTKFLLNGLDNSIGARWQARYRSMHDNDTAVNPSEDCGTSATMSAMSTWGRDTNFGDVTLGTLNNYIPRNGAFYNTGTITQSGTAVTGSGTTWTSDYIGGIITYLDGTTATIVSVNSTTSLTVSTSKTIGSAQAYSVEGGNINCARFYYMFISIDASQTYGYPDDVDRGPTIWDLSLFFTADPSKRLIHGKTFTGGEQQPLDTPF